LVINLVDDLAHAVQLSYEYPLLAKRNSIEKRRENEYIYAGMEKILVSACLLGDKTRYDGGSNPFPFLDELAKKYELVPFCPELEAGLSVPRPMAEIVRNEVVNKDGVNLTKNYNEAAEKAYRVCLFLGIKIAILKDGSPACGSRFIHNGKFDGGKIEGLGVTARYLISKGIKVYSETDNLQFLLGNSEKKKGRSPIEKEKNKYFAQAKAKDEKKDPRSYRKGIPTRKFSKDQKFDHKDKRFAKKDYTGNPLDKKRPYYSNKKKDDFHKNEGNHSFGKKRSFEKKGSFSKDRKPNFHSNNSYHSPRKNGYRSFAKKVK